MAVAGVLLGIGTLLWLTGGPHPDGPAVRPAALAVGPGATPSPAAAPAPPSPEPPSAASASVSAQAPPAPPPGGAPSQEPVVAPVTVLNNSRSTGLAARAAARFTAAGWPVREIRNLRGRIRATTVYYAPGQEASARAFAAAFPGVARVLPRLPELPGRGLTVVLTRDVAD